MNKDREVAELVMGWEVGRFDDPIPEDDYDAYFDSGRNFKYRLKDFKPKTNINHAMEVEAEMFSRGYSIELRHGQNERDRRYEWYAVFLKAGHRYYAFGATLEEAICLAALRAVK